MEIAMKDLFKTGTGSNGDANEWEDILGSDVKAALDKRYKRLKRGRFKTISGGSLSPAAALYWHSLIQEHLRLGLTHLLRSVARSISDGTVLLNEVVDDLNAQARAKREAEAKAQREVEAHESLVQTMRLRSAEEVEEVRRQYTKEFEELSRQYTKEVMTIRLRSAEQVKDVKSMSLTDEQDLWLRHRITPTGLQTKEGRTKHPSQREIAAAMDVSKQSIYRLEKTMEAREDVRAFLAKRNVPLRKPRGNRTMPVTKRKKE